MSAAAKLKNKKTVHGMEITITSAFHVKVSVLVVAISGIFRKKKMYPINFTYSGLLFKVIAEKSRVATDASTI